jgi:hypothetical protein
MTVLQIQTPTHTQCFPVGIVETIRRVHPPWYTFGQYAHAVEIITITGRVYRIPCRSDEQAALLYANLGQQLAAGRGGEPWEEP